METRPKVREAFAASELDRIFRLRFEILRKPWQQSYESASDGKESESINAFIEIDGETVACGRLQKIEDNAGQIRYMAVAADRQKQGLGALILEHLENRAREFKLFSVRLQARENAVPFYRARGYVVKEKTFLLWGRIQHFLMEKPL